ncbi:MAG: bifunctional (p)ppGpp synthetase/guanosine-3',5'-bis(diphosphate) 3'-pyrophosphohydrolase [Deltaproteobacteria bacterium]|nr:bifunctional (p)ppGpp synthetase/guanosine-3',5'-bis(diphosphate) 3'-pyrophosphohydrolase [Deltaproteobacteria bacterium]
MPLISVNRGRRPDLGQALGEILEILHNHEDRVDDERVHGAFQLAMQIHASQKRKDGLPYMVHPLAVAHTCAEHWMTDVSVSAALLHDTLEDADKREGLTEKVLRERFGGEVAGIVGGVTKLERNLGEDGTDHRVETLKKLLHATAREDIRIIILKIFDRHHNVKTLSVFNEDKRRRIGEETMRFYVPIADRLGFYRVARQMEDDVFRTLQPATYQKYVKWFKGEERRNGPEIRRFIDDIRRDLGDKGIDMVDEFFAKGVFAVHQMARDKDGEVDLQRLEEIPAFNICLIVPDTDACFRTLNMVHSRFQFVPGQVRDFINNPKINGYQSLHTIVRSTGASRITVVIRTPEMDWSNRHGVITELRTGRVQEGGFLKDLVESFDIINPGEILELTGRLFFPEIDVTSPAGQTFKLPEGATALDFAYHIHTDLGHRAKTAFVGGQERKLGARLAAGQKVEIVKAKEPQVSPAWFNWVRTDKARLAIRKYLSRMEKEAARDEPARFTAYLKQKLGVGLKPDGPEIRQLRDKLGLSGKDQLGRHLLLGLVSYDHAVAKLVPLLGRRDLRKLLKVLLRDGILTREKHREIESASDEEAAGVVGGLIEEHAREFQVPCLYVDVEGARHDIPVRFALCCQPSYGDSIVAVATRDRGITIHREPCGNVSAIRQLDSIHLVSARWKQSPKTHRVLVQVEGTDRRNLLHDLTRVLAEFRVNIIELSIRAVEGEWFGGMILLEVSDLTSLETLVQRFNAVPSLKVTDSWALP